LILSTRLLKQVFFSGTEEEPVEVSRLVSNYYTGPLQFNYGYIDFYETFKHMLGSTIRKEQRIVSNHSALTIASSTEPKILSSLAHIIEIANTPFDKVSRNTHAHTFRDNLADICVYLFSLIGDIGTSDVIVPLAGGAIIADMLPLNKESIIAVDCKRIPLLRAVGEFGFGMSLEAEQKQREFFLKRWTAPDKDTVYILEVAVASGMTTTGILLDMYSRGTLPAQVVVISPVIAQQGYEFVNTLAKSLGIRMVFIVGAIFYRLGDFYQENTDSLLTDDGKFVVGRATKVLGSFG